MTSIQMDMRNDYHMIYQHRLMGGTCELARETRNAKSELILVLAAA